MSKTIRVLALTGSTRSESFNKKLIRAATDIGKAAGHSFSNIDLRDYPLPLYDEDVESAEGLPPKALEIKKLIAEHDAVLVSSPEYNASLSGVLKNTIDWISRPGDDDDPGAVFSEKPVGLLSASPGGLGGIRGLNHLRTILQNVGAFVIPSQFALAQANQAFNADGTLKNDMAAGAIRDVIEQLAKTVRIFGGAID